MPVASDCGTIFIFSQKETGNRDPGLLPQTTYASLIGNEIYVAYGFSACQPADGH